MIGELLHQGPPLVHQVGREWVDVYFFLLAAVPGLVLILGILDLKVSHQYTDFKHRRTTPKGFFNYKLIIFKPILTGDFLNGV